MMNSCFEIMFFVAKVDENYVCLACVHVFFFTASQSAIDLLHIVQAQPFPLRISIFDVELFLSCCIR